MKRRLLRRVSKILKVYFLKFLVIISADMYLKLVCNQQGLTAINLKKITG